jgi:hypothetical protein
MSELVQFNQQRQQQKTHEEENNPNTHPLLAHTHTQTHTFIENVIIIIV